MVTLKQIAEKLNISITTVSKALKDYPDVSKKTRKLVRETASMLHYKPNSFAVNLRTKESKTIGLIIPEIVHHFFSSVIKGIISQAEKVFNFLFGTFKSLSSKPDITLVAIFATEILEALETKGTVLLALGFTSKT